jgi:hypothetical protein
MFRQMLTVINNILEGTNTVFRETRLKIRGFFEGSGRALSWRRVRRGMSGGAHSGSVPHAGMQHTFRRERRPPVISEDSESLNAFIILDGIYPIYPIYSGRTRSHGSNEILHIGNMSPCNAEICLLLNSTSVWSVTVESAESAASLCFL